MNQKFATKLNDTACSSCFCEYQKFLHHVWDGSKDCKICTSCVLFSNTESFCPTCLAVHDFSLGEKLITCKRCHSYSHPICFSFNSRPSGAPSSCSTCQDPNRLIFDPMKLNEKGENGYYKGLVQNEAELLLTASMIVKMSLFKASEIAENSAEMRVRDAVAGKKKATIKVNSVMKVVDMEINRHINGPSLLDPSTDSDEEAVV